MPMNPPNQPPRLAIWGVSASVKWKMSMKDDEKGAEHHRRHRLCGKLALGGYVYEWIKI